MPSPYPYPLTLGLSLTARPGPGLRWPLDPGTSYPASGLLQTYGQFEGCDGSQGIHRGLDIRVGSAAPVTVRAIEAGRVSHVADGDSTHSALMVASSTSPNSGFKYLHLQPYTITVSVGDVVSIGDSLAHVAYDYPLLGAHLHLSRLQGFGGVSGGMPRDDMYASANPLPMLSPRVDPTGRPESLNATVYLRDDDATFSAPFTHDLNSPFSPGSYDIIVRVEYPDLRSRVGLAPYEVSATLTPATGTARTWTLRCEGRLSPYADDPYVTVGDLTSQGCPHKYEYYFIVTNADPTGAGPPNRANCWDATVGDYALQVVVRDTEGNSYGSGVVRIRVR